MEQKAIRGDGFGPSEETVFLSPAKLGQRWSISLPALAAMRQRGNGPRYFQTGGKNSAVRYSLQDVLAWEAAQLRRSPPRPGPDVEPELPLGGSSHGS